MLQFATEGAFGNTAGRHRCRLVSFRKAVPARRSGNASGSAPACQRYLLCKIESRFDHQGLLIAMDGRRQSPSRYFNVSVNDQWPMPLTLVRLVRPSTGCTE